MFVRVSTTVSASCARGKVRNSSTGAALDKSDGRALEFFLMIRSLSLMAWDEVPRPPRADR